VIESFDEGAEYLYKGLKTLKQHDENDVEDNDEVLMEKGEEEDFLEELASWGKLTLGERQEERREAERKKEISNSIFLSPFPLAFFMSASHIFIVILQKLILLNRR
jgi:hypothetical protein